MTSTPKKIPVPTTEGANAFLYEGCPDDEFEVPGAWLGFSEFRPSSLSGSPVASIGVYDKSNKLYGAVVARGLITTEAPGPNMGGLLEFKVFWPKTQAWGYGQQDFLKDRAAAHCVLQYASEAYRIFQGFDQETVVLFKFEEGWDDESFLGLKVKLVKEFNTFRFGSRENRHGAPEAKSPSQSSRQA